jgi:pimeloyl-ACP methyl ester carboxylesterase
MGRPGAAVRALLAVLAAALVLVGCGRDGDRDDQGEPTPTTTASLPPPLDLCPGSIQGVRGFSVAADGGHVQAAMFGSGATTVVFANDSGNNPCEWLDFAPRLVAGGARVVLFKYADFAIADPARQVAAVAARARRDGGQRIALVGASLGGRAVVTAAARQPALGQVVVSLSGERTIQGDPHDLLADARRLRTPVLWVGSREDFYTRQGRDTRELYQATPKTGQLLLVDGNLHGVDLLQGPDAAKIVPAVERFAHLLTPPMPPAARPARSGRSPLGP